MNLPGDLSARLRATFIGELEEQIVALNTGLLALEQQPTDMAQIRTLFRVAHTVKGAARAAMVPAVEQACHALETFLARVRDGSAGLQAPQFSALFAAADALTEAAATLRAGHEIARDSAITTWFIGFDPSTGQVMTRRRFHRPAALESAGNAARVERDRDPVASASREETGASGQENGAAGESIGESIEESIGGSVDESVQDLSRDLSPEFPEAPVEEPAKPPAAKPPARQSTSASNPQTSRPTEVVRVGVDRLDQLLATTGQLLGLRRDAEVHIDEFESLRQVASQALGDWRRSARHFRLAVGRIADTSETAETRRAVERLLQRTEEHLRDLAGRTERLAMTTGQHWRSIGTITDDVLGQVRRLRMRPFADACEALPRVVRDVAGSDKTVRLEVIGGDVEADRAVLDGLREALLHVVRNAVDHGIEPIGQRVAAGKPPEGTVTITASVRGDRLIVAIADDGAGIDTEAVRARMQTRGQAPADDDAALARALFAGDLSTRASASNISGRGVGMDLIRAAIERIHGTVSLDWWTGHGTTITLTCPPTLASMRVVLTLVGNQIIALPTADVVRLLRIPRTSLQRIEGRHVVIVDDVALPLAVLAQLLPPLVDRPLPDTVLVVLVRGDAGEVALVVDDLLSEEEILLQPLSDRERRSPLLSGAAILGSGSVALVLDPMATIAAALERSLRASAEGEGEVLHRRARVLVVDDSITTRALEQGILEAAGYEVFTAVDGADGWRSIQEFSPDLVVSDIEMPRMDGFALCEAIRKSTRFRDLPVVLVTALETPEHRARGLDVGADAYLGKSTFDQSGLLQVIEELLS